MFYFDTFALGNSENKPNNLLQGKLKLKLWSNTI